MKLYSLGALVAIVVVACSSSTTDTAATTSAPDTRRNGAPMTPSTVAGVPLDCTDPIGRLRAPDPGTQQIAGAIALQTSASSHVALQTDLSSQGNPAQRLFAKAALWVRTGTTAEVVVAPEWIGRLAVEWGNTSQRRPTQRLVVGPCPGPGAWIVFPGGYYVPRPACVDLIVRVARVNHHLSIGVGTPCRGQRPPPQPTST